MLYPEDIRSRLETIQRPGGVALGICVASPLIYYLLLLIYREDVSAFIDSVIAIYPRNISGLILVVLLAIPIIVVPPMYRFFGTLLAAGSDLACPACSRLITSGRDWNITLYTRRCPHCAAYIVSAEPTPDREKSQTVDLNKDEKNN